MTLTIRQNRKSEKMKYINFAFLLLITAFACNNESSDETTNKRYDIESAVIKYTTDMMGIQSKSTLYFTNYGQKECTESRAKNMGQESRSRRFIANGFAYTLNMNNKTGSKMKIKPLPDSIINPEDINFRNIPQGIKKRYNIQEAGEEKIAGKTCTVFSLELPDNARQRISVWKNIPLKIEFIDDGFQVVTTATEIIENPDIPDTLFTIPEDFTINEYKPEETAARHDLSL